MSFITSRSELLWMSSTVTNGKEAEAESDPNRGQASAGEAKQEVSAAEKSLTEEKNKLQQDLKDLKVSYCCHIQFFLCVDLSDHLLCYQETTILHLNTEQYHLCSHCCLDVE